ncbi:MAG: SDR family oxidoreductase [Pseudomonadota bacterium]
MPGPTATYARPLQDQSAIVVGATSGIGRATAIALAVAGLRAIRLVGRSAARGADALDAVRVAAPGAIDADFIEADCADGAAAEAMATGAARAMGRIDLLVTSAGGANLPELLFKQPIGAIESVLTRDLLPNLNAVRAVVPVMMDQPDGGAPGGCLLAVASDAGKVATPGETVIGAAMAATIQFMRGVAVEGRRNGIRANTLTPSLVEGTPLTDRLMAEGTFSKKLFEKARPMAALGPTYAEDLAALAVFLASPAAAKITGQAISVNGGISAA